MSLVFLKDRNLLSNDEIDNKNFFCLFKQNMKTNDSYNNLMKVCFDNFNTNANNFEQLFSELLVAFNLLLFTNFYHKLFFKSKF
jgi:hypothetical protein